jgi:hypothetical protein
MKKLTAISFLCSLFLIAGCSGSSSGGGEPTTATGNLTGASNAAPTTPGTRRFKLELVQTAQACGGCGWLFDSTKLVIEHSAGTLTKTGGQMFVRKSSKHVGNLDWDISAIPANATINKATLYLVFNVHEGLANGDWSSVVETYGWINNQKTPVKTIHAKTDIKDRGYNKANNNVPFDYTAYAKKL